ncbi:hypothetical protein N7462_000053 [Penicillium macrosclerotiorum]|uniref:uncharacterized protein n=1 Tax=Penicillium macrosclerotiorum TaxID=303699 RepID=UPI002547A7F9|nr:uncharacterized protein N7462_000053 [Penicillium macrosclerotiorum]KAJ5698048.1 hypothetical protein N7462_000053 [Penicillium macrosclerotiorum]
MESANLRPEPPPDPFRIKRKPLSNPNLRGAANAGPSGRLAHATSSPALVPPPLSQPPSYNDLYGQETTNCGWRNNTRSIPPEPSPSPTPVQKAYGEARHFLGGLINHPTESNKHVTILRHSHGLVFYRGEATSVAVSIFSDAPLPQDRTLWLQNKGWSGKAGMRAKALFRLNNNWVDVTPGMPLRADQVNPDDERAWQRDIKKFLKKAPARLRDTHSLRETAVVRVPAEAGDGYWQLVLCQGPKKKVIGNSPVFRVLSTSTNPHSIRGASLSTLPLEVGAMVASLYAQTAAKAVVSPATAAIQSKLTQTAAQTAYSTSGAQDKVGSLIKGSSGSTQKDQQGLMPHEGLDRQISPIDDGPQTPFPMNFKARAQLPHTTAPGNPGEMPKLILTKFPGWIPEQFRGYFFGWARFDTSTAKSTSLSPWYPAVLSIRTLDPLQAAGVNMSQLAKRSVAIRLLDEVPLQTTELEINVMGFLRAEIPPPTGTTHQELADAQAAAAEAAMLADSYDVTIVQNTLSQPVWAPRGPDPAEIHRQNTGWMDRTKEGYANVRAKGQKWVEQVPLHKLGVRSTTDESREKQVAVNGFYIVR